MLGVLVGALGVFGIGIRCICYILTFHKGGGGPGVPPKFCKITQSKHIPFLGQGKIKHFWKQHGTPIRNLSSKIHEG